MDEPFGQTFLIADIPEVLKRYGLAGGKFDWSNKYEAPVLYAKKERAPDLTQGAPADTTPPKPV